MHVRRPLHLPCVNSSSALFGGNGETTMAESEVVEGEIRQREEEGVDVTGIRLLVC